MVTGLSPGAAIEAVGENIIAKSNIIAITIFLFLFIQPPEFQTFSLRKYEKRGASIYFQTFLDISIESPWWRELGKSLIFVGIAGMGSVIEAKLHSQYFPVIEIMMKCDCAVISIIFGRYRLGENIFKFFKEIK